MSYYLSALATFAVIHLLAAASPGPNLFLVSSTSASVSRRSGGLVAAGILLAVLTWSSVTALGLSAVISKSPMLYTSIQYIGAIYLIWLGVKMIWASRKDQSGISGSASVQVVSDWTFVLRGYVVNMTNPKTIAYYTSLFAVLIPPGSPTWVYFAAVCVAVSVSSIWWLSVAFLFSSSWARRVLHKSQRKLDFLMGSALVVLGAKLAIDR